MELGDILYDKLSDICFLRKPSSMILSTNKISMLQATKPSEMIETVLVAGLSRTSAQTCQLDVGLIWNLISP